MYHTHYTSRIYSQLVWIFFGRTGHINDYNTLLIRLLVRVHSSFVGFGSLFLLLSLSANLACIFNEKYSKTKQNRMQNDSRAHPFFEAIFFSHSSLPFFAHFSPSELYNFVTSCLTHGIHHPVIRSMQMKNSTFKCHDLHQKMFQEFA